MGKSEPNKNFDNLNFYVWRLWNQKKNDWEDDRLLVGGSDESYENIIQMLDSILEVLPKYHKTTRRVKCHPNESIDFLALGKKYGYKFHFINTLIVKAVLELQDSSIQFDGDNIIVQASPGAIQELIENIKEYLSTAKRLGYGIGRYALGNLWLSPDVFGAE